jgi:hypothetical protein
MKYEPINEQMTHEFHFFQLICFFFKNQCKISIHEMYMWKEWKEIVIIKILVVRTKGLTFKG